MKKLIKMAVITAALVGLTACGGGGTAGRTNTKGGSSNSDISINQALKGKSTLKIHADNEHGFKISPDGTKMYNIGAGVDYDSFSIEDMTQVELYPSGNPRGFKNISRLKLFIPQNENESTRLESQTVSKIELSPDGKTAYVTTYDVRSDGWPGRLIIIDVSNPKKPEILFKKTLGLYFDGSIKATPNGKYLLAVTKTKDDFSENLTLIDIQDPKQPKVVDTLSDIDNLSGWNDITDINEIAISANSKRAYIVTSNTTEIINLEDNLLRHIKMIKRGGSGIAITKDRKRMYKSIGNNVEVYNIEDDKMTFMNQLKTDTTEVVAVTLSPDEKRLYASGEIMTADYEGLNDQLLVVDISDKDKLVFKKSIEMPDSIVLTYDPSMIAISPDGKKFYAMQVWFYITNLEE